MKLPIQLTLKEIAGLINCEFDGNPDHPVTGLNEIHMVEAGDIVFVDHPRHGNTMLAKMSGLTDVQIRTN